MYPSIWKKRSQDMIMKSGAYEREQYWRTSPLSKNVMYGLKIVFSKYFPHFI